MKKKVVVGLSGGVDSAVAALILKKQGYEVIGVTMQMRKPNLQAASDASVSESRDVHAHQMIDEVAKPEGMAAPVAENANVGEAAANADGAAANAGEATADARAVADRLGIPFYVFDFSDVFEEKVIDYFTQEYLHARTPNPCIRCNRYVKWEALLEKARELGADSIATGHYAKVTRLENGRYAVQNSAYAKKDQTYALYLLTQEQLAHTLFPVGDYSKEEIRAMATEAGLVIADKPDSQDICFVPDGDYAGFLARSAADKLPPQGNYVTKDGKVLGQHQGIIHYTIGQRKGLGLSAGHPVFVTQIRADTNEVVIGENEELFSDTLFCDQVNYMGIEGIDAPLRCMAKVRYAHKGAACTVEPAEGESGRLKVTFEQPVRAITPGQAVVFYEDGHVLGGGSIC